MEPNPIVEIFPRDTTDDEKPKNQKTEKPKKKKEKKERKRINLTEHDPSERVLFARANTRGRNSEPIAPLHPPLLFLPPPTTLHSPFSPSFFLRFSFILFTLLLFFFLSFFFPPLENEISCSIHGPHQFQRNSRLSSVAWT